MSFDRHSANAVPGAASAALSQQAICMGAMIVLPLAIAQWSLDRRAF